MSERQAAKLFQGVTGIDDDIIEEALTAPPASKKASVWRRWGMVAACLCLTALAGMWIWRSTGASDTPLHIPDGSVTGTDVFITNGPDGMGEIDGGGCTLPGGFAPVLRVGDTLYEWTRISVRLFLDPSGSCCSSGDGSTYLPEGYQPLGEIGGITRELPSENLQLQAGFEASGTVFVSEEHPAVVYVLMTTDWFEDSYVRFVSDALGGNELLSWHGQMYRLSIDFDACKPLEELPEGCELIGNLHYVGDDSIPTGDLETNNRSDVHAKPFDGREVYAIPGDNSTLYVYEHHYWAKGDYPTWRECRLWEP